MKMRGIRHGTGDKLMGRDDRPSTDVGEPKKRLPKKKLMKKKAAAFAKIKKD